MDAAIPAPNKGKQLSIAIEGQEWLRIPIKSPLIAEHDDLMELLEKFLAPHLQKGDYIFISEKVLALSQGRIVLIKNIKPTPLARFLAKRVNNKVGTPDFRGFGHGTSMAMQLFIEEAGVPRVLFAAAVAAVTRPLGIKGMFYRISGKRAKSVDCPMSFDVHPYLNYAKRSPLDPNGFAKKVRERFGAETAIVDANYRGVFSLGRTRGLSERFIQAVLRDNPAGQADEMTPFFLIRRAAKQAAPAGV